MPRLLTLGLVAGALVVSAATTGCSSSKSSTTTSQSPAAGSSASAGGATGKTVTVTENEYSLHVSQTTFTAGTYTFVAQDTGHVSHALAIAGPGVSTAQTATIDPGSTANLTVTLQKGSYELWCPVDGHKSLGMDTHIQVS